MQEFREVNQWHNAIEVNELISEEVADEPRRAECRTRSRTSTTSSPACRARARSAIRTPRALEARTKLAAYVGNTPWVDANRDNPEAIQAAERLVKGGLRRAAADHTNLARGYAASAGNARSGPGSAIPRARSPSTSCGKWAGPATCAGRERARMPTRAATGSRMPATGSSSSPSA